MEKKKLIDELAKLTELSIDFIKYLEENLIQENYKKGDSLLNKDEIINKTWFVVKGLLKSRYYDQQGKQIVTRFWKEDEIVILKEKDIMAGATYVREDIVLLENSTLLSLPDKQLIHLYDSFEEIHLLTRKLHFQELRNRNIRQQLLVMQGNLAYDQFGRYFPMNRIQLQDIAGYLNLTPHTISMIRRERN